MHDDSDMAPTFGGDAFNCPVCGAYASQNWGKVYSDEAMGPMSQVSELDGMRISFCDNCDEFSLWWEEEKIYPLGGNAPSPNEDLPKNVKKYYREADSVIDESPRSAAALLRLAIQHLVEELEAEGGTLYKKIGDLVDDGLDEKVQKSLDSLRVIGNESVHPGQLDMDDDRETASALFDLVNIIARQMISEDRQVQEMWNKIPDSKKKGVKDRDDGD